MGNQHVQNTSVQHIQDKNAAFMGVFTHTEPIFSMDEQIISTKQVIEDNPYISGISIKLRWNAFHPEKSLIYWDKLEQLIDIAASNGKRVHLIIIPGFYTPEWVYRQGAVKVGPVTVGGTDGYSSIPWDEVFMKTFSEDINLIAKRYAEDARLSAIGIMGHNYKGEEMHAVKQVDMLVSYGYSKETVLENWRYWIDLYGTLFPQKKLIVVISQMYPNATELPGKVADYFVEKYKDRAILQTDQLNGREEIQHQSFEICSKHFNYAPNGHEMVGSFKEQKERQGSPEMTIYNFIRMGNPLYLQLWRRDCDDPCYAKALLDAWAKYKDMQPEEVKNYLKQAGLFTKKSNWDPVKFAELKRKSQGSDHFVQRH